MHDKVKRIQVLNKYVDNKDFDNNSFYLYIILKTVCINNHVNIYKSNLLNKLQWTQYQLRKYLKDLKQNKLIVYEFDDLPRYNPIELDIEPIKYNSKNKEDYFTQVDMVTIDKIIASFNEVKFKIDKEQPKVKRDVKEKALRLFYLYEMYYNEKYKCAFIGYEKIKDSMQLNNAYIKVINNAFSRNELVGVMIGDWREDTDNDMRRRNPNNYVPYCNRINNRKEEK